jgi:hypothetical protein
VVRCGEKRQSIVVAISWLPISRLLETHGQIYCEMRIKVWRLPQGQKLDLHPTNPTYLNVVMGWKGLGLLASRRVVEYVGLRGGFLGKAVST